MWGARAAPSALIARGAARLVTSCGVSSSCGAPGGRQRSSRSQTRCAPSLRLIPTWPRSHIRASIRATLRAWTPQPKQVEHPRDVPCVTPPATIVAPPDLRPILDVFGPQWPIEFQALVDVRAELVLGPPPLREPPPPAGRAADQGGIEPQV